MLTWACSCITFQYYGWNIFMFCPNSRNYAWRYTYFGAKLAFIVGIFLKKYAWCMKIHFPFHFFAIWSIPASIFSITAWKAPASSWSSLPCLVNWSPVGLGCSVNLIILKRFLCSRPVIPDYPFLVTML